MRSTIKSLASAAFAALALGALTLTTAQAEDGHERSRALLRQMTQVNQQEMAAVRAHNNSLVRELDREYQRLQGAYFIVLKNEYVTIEHNKRADEINRNNR